MGTEQGYHGIGMGTGQRYHRVSFLGYATSADWFLGDCKVSPKQPLQMLPLAALTVTFILYKKWSNFLKIKSCRIFSSPKKKLSNRINSYYSFHVVLILLAKGEK